MDNIETTRSVVDQVQSKIHEVLKPILSSYDAFAIVDVPIHNNVGDSAIFLGESAYFRRHHAGAGMYLSRGDRWNPDRLRTISKNSLILIHGGGNFGDIWPWHHQRREMVLEQNPGRMIVQLPQSIHFESKSALEKTKSIIKKHGNFVLLVRDERSYEFATSEFECTTILCPDMAFYMGMLDRAIQPIYDILLLLRDDKERAQPAPYAFKSISDYAVADWPADSRLLRAVRQAVALSQTVARPSLPFTRNSIGNDWLEHLAMTRLRLGLQLLSSGRHIVTDRLHACILALLLDIPCSAIDNNYGKLSGFISTWLPNLKQLRLFADLDRAITASSP